MQMVTVDVVNGLVRVHGQLVMVKVVACSRDVSRKLRGARKKANVPT